MNPLDLAAMNRVSPYHIGEAEVGTYVFQTDKGLMYSISFCEDMEIAGCLSYQFGINRLSDGKKGGDEAIRNTILVILEEFFDKNDDILLYICDTKGGKEAARNRLFIRWFRETDAEKRFTLKTASTIVEGIGFYTAIIIKNTNPKLAEIVAEFDLVAENLTNK